MVVGVDEPFGSWDLFSYSDCFLYCISIPDIIRIVLFSIAKYNTVKPVYKGHSRSPVNVTFMSSWPLYTG